MTNERYHIRTNRFTVRLRIAAVAEDQMAVRGRVQHVFTGDVTYFPTWQKLITVLDTLMVGLATVQST